MVAARIAYSRGRSFARKASAAFAVFFGLFALFFVATPNLWGSRSVSRDGSLGFFAQNTAHAEVPDYIGGDSGAGGDGDSDAGGGGDSGCGDSGDSGGCCA